MKVLIVTMFIIALSGVATSRRESFSTCFSRRQKTEMAREKKSMKCENPTKQLVTLKVPQGFDFVLPSMKALMRCSGMMCWGMNRGCVAVETEPVQLKAEAKMMNGEKMCVEIDEVNHVKCKCGCTMTQENCGENQELDQNTCSCKCTKEAKDACEGNGKMWRDDQCSCECVNEIPCHGNSVWVKEHCSCMEMSNGA